MVEKVTLVLWGAAATLVCDHPAVQQKVQAAVAAGVQVTARKACADPLGVSRRLKALGIEVTYWGKPLTEILKNGEPLLTVRTAPGGTRHLWDVGPQLRAPRHLVGDLRSALSAAGGRPASIATIVSERRLC